MGRDPELPDEPDWPVLESRVEYETGWYTGGYDEVEQPDGSRHRYYWAELSTAVVIVPVVDDRVICIEQYRPTIRQHQLELPAGIVEAGESLTQAAERELREETGYAAEGVSVLQKLWIATGVLRHQRAIVFAEGLSPVAPDRDDNEFLQVRSIPRSDVLEAVMSPPTNDATLSGILVAGAEGLL